MDFDSIDATATTTAPDPATPITDPQTTGPVNGLATAGGLDINSLDQFNDVEEIDAEASVYDQTPPPPDGYHPCIVRVVKDGIDQSKRIAGDQFQNALGYFQFTDRDGKLQKHLMLAVEFQINEEGKPWHKQTYRDWVNTMKDGDTTSADSLLRVLTGNAGVGMANNAKMQKLYSALVTEPGVSGKTRWILQATEKTPVLGKDGKPKTKQSGEDKTEFKTFLYGMAAFPEDKDAQGNVKKWPDGTVKRKPLTEDPKEGHSARTKWEITDLRPIGGGQK